MAENSNTNSNSWTILAPEVQESRVESMGPLLENKGDVQKEPALTQSSALSDAPTEQTPPLESPQVAPLEGSEDVAITTGNEDTESSIPAHVENIAFLISHSGEQGSSGDDYAGQGLNDTESFSDSYTHIIPSPFSTSLPGTLEEEEEEEEKVLLAEDVKSELKKTLREEHKSEDKANEVDGLRRRNISVLTPLYHREEEEEEAEEEQFRHPQREGEGDIGFTLNKCIFGALILLGLGTIFFSGVFLDLDDERDVDAKDLKYSETKKDWLDPDALPGDVQPPEILDKLAKETQVTGLQAQLQKQELELNEAQQQVDEVTKERLLREELEAEIQRMRGELDKLPVLQKEVEQENQRIKRESDRLNKELKELPALQKEVEHLKDRLMELTQSTVSMEIGTPSAGHNDVQGHQERKEKKGKALHKERDVETENKDWKKEKKTKVDEKQGRGKSSKDEKHWENEKDERWKRDGKNKKKGNKEDDGHRWKLDSEQREFKEKSGKRDTKGDKKWGKEKHEEFVDRKGKEHKEWKYKSEQKAWKKEEEWKGDKQASQESKEWKEKREKSKNRKDGSEWNSEKKRDGSDEKKYSERMQKEKTRKGKHDDHDTYSGPKERWEKHKSGKDKDEPKSGQRSEEWKDEKKYKDKNRNKEEKMNRKTKHETSAHSYSDRKHSNDHVHMNYWDKQREKIRHYYGSTEGCADVTACAHEEGLDPVSQQDFQSFVMGYLTKLQGHGDLTTRKDKLNNLLGEFFNDGVFVHDQIPFSEFVEDVEDILEDLADNDDEELENEMKGFAIEAMETFVHPKKEANEERRVESGRKRMKG